MLDKEAFLPSHKYLLDKARLLHSIGKNCLSSLLFILQTQFKWSSQGFPETTAGCCPIIKAPTVDGLLRPHRSVHVFCAVSCRSHAARWPLTAHDLSPAGLVRLGSVASDQSCSLHEVTMCMDPKISTRGAAPRVLPRTSSCDQSRFECCV